MTDKRIALLTGSFDPLTYGHYDIAIRCAELFDTVYVVGFYNSEKTGMFTPEERLAILRAAFDGHRNIKTDVSSGMVAEYAEKINAGVIVKGLRTTADFEYEYNLGEISRRLSPEVETLFMPSMAELAYISSSYVRELIKYRKPLEGAVPEGALEVLYSQRDKKFPQK